MQRSRDIARAILFSCAVLVFAGCSVFGVATKGELEAQQARWEDRETALVAQTEDLRRDLEDVTRDLETYEKELEPRLASMQSELG